MDAKESRGDKYFENARMGMGIGCKTASSSSAPQDVSAEVPLNDSFLQPISPPGVTDGCSPNGSDIQATASSLAGDDTRDMTPSLMTSPDVSENSRRVRFRETTADLTSREHLLDWEKKLSGTSGDDDDEDGMIAGTNPPVHHGLRRDRSTFLIRTSTQDWSDSESVKGTYLPESTYTLFITVGKCYSPAFMLAVAAAILSIMCLIFALVHSLHLRSDYNPLGLPVDVSPLVRGAQFLGIMIGVLMEDDIPQGLELLAISFHGIFVLGDAPPIHRRVLLSSILQLIIGYMFLAALFVITAQSSGVLQVFFDLLALNFVESIDRVAYDLGKRGFFGITIWEATKKKHKLETIDNDGGLSSNSCAHRFARLIYYLNLVLLLSLFGVVAFQQHHGEFRCGKLTVEFDEKVWEDAYVTVKEDFDEPWHLVYSYFNGVYEEEAELYDDFPRYTERNKNDGYPFKHTVGAEFIYCKKINSWVFRHDNITTASSSVGYSENECSWLARSPETQEYDLIAVAQEEWFVWTGRVEHLYLHILCNDCHGHWDCNYRGRCNHDDRRCECLGDKYFGDHCQFEQPCSVLKSNAGNGCGEMYLHGDATQFKMIYGRPMYMKENLSGIPSTSSNPENTFAFLLGEDIHPLTEFWFRNHSESLLANYTIFLMFSGSRWYGSMLSPETLTKFRDVEFLSDYHAFWEHSYMMDSTFLISDMTFESCPVTTEFSLGSRQVEHVDFDSSGLFRCMAKSNCE